MARKKKKDSQESKRKKAKRNSSILEYEIMKMMESCLKMAINTAIDSVIKDF